MQCDICGKKIVGKPNRVIVEGARVITCANCAKFGSGWWNPENETRQKKDALDLLKSSKRSKSFPQQLSSEEDFEVIEGFGSIVKSAREKLGLTPEDLGKMIGEKESVIKKIESEKIVPDIRLASKLERALKIKIMVKQSTLNLSEPSGITARGKRSLTLGEIVEIKSEKKGGSDES